MIRYILLFVTIHWYVSVVPATIMESLKNTNNTQHLHKVRNQNHTMVQSISQALAVATRCYSQYLKHSLWPHDVTVNISSTHCGHTMLQSISQALTVATRCYSQYLKHSLWPHDVTVNISSTHCSHTMVQSISQALTVATRCYSQYLKHSLWSWIIKLYCINLVVFVLLRSCS